MIIPLLQSISIILSIVSFLIFMNWGAKRQVPWLFLLLPILLQVHNFIYYVWQLLGDYTIPATPPMIWSMLLRVHGSAVLLIILVYFVEFYRKVGKAG